MFHLNSTMYRPFPQEEVWVGHRWRTSWHPEAHSWVSGLFSGLSRSPVDHMRHGPLSNTDTYKYYSCTRCRVEQTVTNVERYMKQYFTREQHISSMSEVNAAQRCVCRYSTFWVAVRSSARQVARFLAHWPSCIAAAWSATVGTADFADATILLPGWGMVTEKPQQSHGFKCKQIVFCILIEIDGCRLCHGERKNL